MVMKRKYKKSDVVVIAYGSGRNKRFIIYTDYEELPNTRGPWHTRVYPDVRGNQMKAVLEALEWLNEGTIGEPWIYRNSPSKFFLSYNANRG